MWTIDSGVSIRFRDPLESAGDEVRIERAINDIRAKHKAAA